MELLTFFTPAYNRAYTLPRLYESLLRQTDSRFEWVIVDDGSKDNTEDLVNGWINDGKIKIVYQKQENQGKHIAVNTGVNIASGELFFIVDSDDFVSDDATQKVFDFWEEQQPDETISGILSYKNFSTGKLSGFKLPENVKKCKFRDTIRKYGSYGEKTMIYKTDVLKKYPYPKFKGERFLGESYVFNQIDDNYDMLVLDDVLYYFEYQENGLSQDFRKLYRNNPNGFLICYEQSVKYQKSFKRQIKTYAHICCLRLRLHKYFKGFKGGAIFKKLLATPLGIALYFKIFVLKMSDVKHYTQSQDDKE